LSSDAIGGYGNQAFLFSEIHGENKTKRKLLSWKWGRELKGEGK
jgi:hypothetical protein